MTILQNNFNNRVLATVYNITIQKGCCAEYKYELIFYSKDKYLR